MPDLALLDLVLLALATWYVAEVVTHQDGPFGVFDWLRRRFPLGGLTSCIVCASFWAALVLFVVHWRIAPVVTWVFAAAGLALMLRSYTGVRHDV